MAYELKKISKELYESCISDPERTAALVFAIEFKRKKPTSIMRGYSLRALSDLMGYAVNTTHKRVETLKSMNLACVFEINGTRYFKVKKLRAPKVQVKNSTRYFSPKYQDIDISDIKETSHKDIKLGLRTLYIRLTEERKARLRQLIELAGGLAKGDLAQIKRAKRIMRKCGLTVSSFVDGGLSYSYLREKCSCGQDMVKRMGDYGQAKGWFYKETPELVHVGYFPHRAKEALLYQNDSRVFATRCNLYLQPSCRYHLLSTTC